MEQVQPDETSSAAVDIACDDPVKLAEHYRDLCVRLTEQLEKAKSKAAQRKKRIQVLEDRNKELTNENAALQLKLSQYEMENNDESNRAENENERMIPSEAMKVSTEESPDPIQVSTEGSADDKEMGNGRVCGFFESNWTARYNELVVYKDNHGHCNVSRRDEANKTLANWVNDQRKAFKNGKLSNARAKKLNGIGFVWGKQNDNVCWTTRYDELVVYKAEHGDCNVPQNYAANKSLANWVCTQRIAFKNGRLSHVRLKKLNVIGFVWEPIKQNEDVWKTRYDELVAYKAEHGDCNVPQNYEANKTLGHWVNNQRTVFRNGKLSNVRVKSLNVIGFVWEPLKQNKEVWNDVWTAHYDDLVTYKAENGNCNVPQNYEANKSLGNWVHNQRTAFKVGKLSEEQVRKCNGIGFEWEPRKRHFDAGWKARYDELIYYKDQHGDSNVPIDYKPNKSLGRWVNTQRTSFKNNKLSKERTRLLNQIGFVWKLKGKQRN